ncbi:MAG TPA: M23 family metallopeptidase [Longimicrobiales bacterium]|nr:M23 family metallopeptidase [Longimicrobiales bacterium]
MARREWTVVVAADDDADVRQFRLSREVVRISIALVFFLIAGLSTLAGAFLVGMGAGSADARLLTKNELLERELEELTTRLDTLQISLEDLSRKDEYYRLLAGLEPVDAEVLQAGIGGPDSDSLEASPLFRVDGRTGRRAFSTSTQLNSLLRRASVLAFSWREAEDTMSEKLARFHATPSIYPTKGYVSSSFSNSRWHPILDRPRAHTGIDIVAPRGTPVVASAHGRVSSVGHQGDYGLLVDIDHGYGTVTRYAHLSKAVVRVGQLVERGEHIGNVGQSGLAMGPHLHYEVLVNGQPANPRRYILDGNVLRD